MSLRDVLAQRGFHRIQLKPLDTGHATVPVRINGVAATFVVDTGAGASVIHRGCSLAAGLDQGDSEEIATGLGGTKRMSRHPIDSIEIRDFQADLREMLVLDLSEVVEALERQAHVSVHGVLGQDALQRHRAVLTLEDSAMYLIR